jgi:hypothetical protein
MKRLCLLFTAGVFLTSPAIAQSTNSPAPATPTTTAPAPQKLGALTKEERSELNKDRSNAVKANPDLDAEHKDLDAQRKTLDDKYKVWSQKVDEAAIAIDPNVAAIIAKRDAGKPKPSDTEVKAPTPSTNAPTAAPSAN